MFAGIATRSTRASPCSAASAATSPASRTPHSGSRDLTVVENRVRRRDVAASFLERAIEIKDAARREQPAGSRHEALRSSPGRDVDHVDRDDHVGMLDGPGRPCHVEFQRRQEVRQLGCGAMSRDASECARIQVRRLPVQAGQPGREVNGVLAAPARNLEHSPARRQHTAKDIEDRLAVAAGRWRRERTFQHGLQQLRRDAALIHELHRRALLDHGGELSCIPVGQPHAAVGEALADLRRVRRAVNAVTLNRERDPDRADRIVRAGLIVNGLSDFTPLNLYFGL